MLPSRVLLVDDHAGFRASASAFLAVEGLPVVGTAASGEEAMAAVEACRPDLVLVDLFLPGIDGVEVAERLAARDEPPAADVIAARDDVWNPYFRPR